MVSQEVTVKTRPGIHARPATLLVQRANDFEAQISIRKGNNLISAKSILGILALEATYKSTLEIIAEGEDEEAALEALVSLFENQFEPEKKKKRESP